MEVRLCDFQGQVIKANTASHWLALFGCSLLELGCSALRRLQACERIHERGTEVSGPEPWLRNQLTVGTNCQSSWMSHLAENPLHLGWTTPVYITWSKRQVCPIKLCPNCRFVIIINNCFCFKSLSFRIICYRKQRASGHYPAYLADVKVSFIF